jgi:hypothetical protein
MMTKKIVKFIGRDADRDLVYQNLSTGNYFHAQNEQDAIDWATDRKFLLGTTTLGWTPDEYARLYGPITEA